MKNFMIEGASKILKAIGNAKRLEIAFVLREGEMKVGDLEKRIGLSQSALSQHLAIMRAEGIVQTRRKAQTIYYSIRNEKVLKILSLLENMYSRLY